jgi:cytochrome c peroxidase
VQSSDGRWPLTPNSILKFAVKIGVRKWIAIAVFLVLAGALSATVIPNLFPFFDPTGVVSTYNVNGPIHEDGPFFQSLGTNDRSCGTCHQASDAMGLGVQNVRVRFARTRGKDPLFAAIDGANCPTGSATNPADHSLLLKSGLIRIPLTLPSNAQFTIKAIRDPYGCAIVTDPTTGQQTVSVYRRPLPTTNLRFLSTIMFDGRESAKFPLNSEATFQTNLTANLMQQSIDATLTHAQAAQAPTIAQQQDIVNFELGLFSAQFADFQAGLLIADGAQGGAYNLSQQAYYPGTNDSLGKDPDGNPFNSTAFTMFQPWANLSASHNPFERFRVEARKRIAAGETLFNTRALTISNVRGLNDNAALGTVPIGPFQGTCTTCHDAPNVGDHSLPLPLDIGTGHDATNETDPLIANAISQLDFPDVPVYEISGCPNPFANSSSSAEPYVIYTTDPGKGLISGLCSDVNRVKGPILRGLAARAPYFHNGAAQDLTELLNFYNQRFQMNLTQEEESDLIAFLNSL